MAMVLEEALEYNAVGRGLEKVGAFGEDQRGEGGARDHGGLDTSAISIGSEETEHVCTASLVDCSLRWV